MKITLFQYSLSVCRALLCLVLTTLAIPLLAKDDEAEHAPSSSPKTVTIATGEFPPWTGEKLAHGGFINHLVSAAFATEGIQVKFVFLPWKRAYEKTKHGDYDLTSYWYENPDRREAMLFSDPVIVNRTVFFQRQGDTAVAWGDLKDLASVKISYTQSFTYTEAFYKAINEKIVNAVSVPTESQNIKLLITKRVDLFATDEMTGFYFAGQLNIDPRKLRVLEPPLNMPNGYLLGGKTNPAVPALLAAFNRGLERLKANGDYEEIIDRVDNTSFYNPSAKEKTQ